MKILFFFPNTSNEGVVSNAITLLSFIAKSHDCQTEYFDTSYYQKSKTAAENRTLAGEFKSVKKSNINRSLRPYNQMIADLENCINDFEPDILAVSCNSLEYELFLELVSKIKIKKKIFTLVGGVHATFSPNDVIRNEYVDAIIVGEGEEAFEEIIESDLEMSILKKIKNVWIKDNDMIFKNEIRNLLSEEKVWTYEKDFSMYGSDDYYMKPFEGELVKKAMVEVSRGCPYSCNYCVNSAYKSLYKGKGKYVRFKSMDILKKELLYYKNNGYDLIQFMDENFLNISEEILREFSMWYNANIDLPLILQGRAENFSENKILYISKMTKNIEMSCGVETGNDRILNDICNRKTSKNQVKFAFELMEKYGLRSRAYVMIGFPGETRENVFETIEFVRQLKPYLTIMSVFYPFVGVPLREDCILKGYLKPDDKARTFTDSSALINQPMSSEEIKNLRNLYTLYVTLPKSMYSKIRDLELNYDINEHERLLEYSWKIRENWPKYILD